MVPSATSVRRRRIWHAWNAAIPRVSRTNIAEMRAAVCDIALLIGGSATATICATRRRRDRRPFIWHHPRLPGNPRACGHRRPPQKTARAAARDLARVPKILSAAPTGARCVTNASPARAMKTTAARKEPARTSSVSASCQLRPTALAPQPRQRNWLDTTGSRRSTRTRPAPGAPLSWRQALAASGHRRTTSVRDP